jgi:nucleoside-diphosphate-sugar epimerase
LRILVAGASGVVRARFVPALLARAHDVVGTTRTTSKIEALEHLGARAVALDLLDGDAVMPVVRDARRDVIVHPATALGAQGDVRRFARAFAPTNPLAPRARAMFSPQPADAALASPLRP